jgi:group I intron endonuclease
MHVSDAKKRVFIMNEKNIQRRKELNREYQERVKPSGVFQIKNLANGKVLLGSSLNLEGPLNKHRFMLRINSHTNKELQRDWNEFGEDQFSFEILETIQIKEDPNFNLKDELTLLEEIWLEKLQPFGERGYNSDAKIREA